MALVRYKKLRDDARKPEYGTKGAAGADLFASVPSTFQPERSGVVEVKQIGIPIGTRALIKTGIAIELDPGFEAQVRSRSGLALKNGVTVLNAPGTIDSDYRGEIGVILINHGENEFVVKDGDRIAQLVIAPVSKATFVFVGDEELSETKRGDGGFGSTGVSETVGA